MMQRHQLKSVISQSSPENEDYLFFKEQNQSVKVFVERISAEEAPA